MNIFRRWYYRRKYCGAWDPPSGAGRDTEICLLLRNHHGRHKCKCGYEWDGPRKHEPWR